MKHINHLNFFIMMGPGPVFIALFIIIFGIFYLHYSTRNKERLALIEKGADASIFFSAKAAQKRSTVPLWKVLILNLAVLLMGIGAGIFIGSILEAYTFQLKKHMHLRSHLTFELYNTRLVYCSF